MEIEGLLLTYVDGLTLTSTFEGNDSTQRLAAASTAMFLLSEQTSAAWGSGESMEVALRLKPTRAKRYPRYVSLKPVGVHAVLIGVYRINQRVNLINADLNTAAAYLDALMRGENPTMPYAWQSR